MLGAKDMKSFEKGTYTGKGASSAGPQNPVAPAPISSSQKDRRHQRAQPQQQRSAPSLLHTCLTEPMQAAAVPQERSCGGPGKLDTLLILQQPALHHDRQQQQQHQHQHQHQENLGSHALTGVCLSEDSSDNDCSASMATNSRQGSVYPPARQPALHRRVPVRVHRGSGTNSSSNSGGKQASSSDGQAASPVAAVRAGSAVGSSRTKAAQAKSALSKREAKGEAGRHVSGASHAPYADDKASKLHAAAEPGRPALPTRSSWSKLAVLVSLLMALPATLWAVQSASAAASLLSALGKWSRDSPQFAPVPSGVPQFFTASSSSSGSSSIGKNSAAFPAASVGFSSSSMQPAQHTGGSAMTSGSFQAGAMKGGFPSIRDIASSGTREVAAQASTRDAADTLTPTYLPTILPATSQQWDPEAVARCAALLHGAFAE
ncbi:hypothetical protein DUNSADRAFT_38 [Dunaliella salina]|uniref:Uncharacterized protein n=1 Tax=Dunaliella salina TaxID=3046 RepID=A0ABQ7HAN6_DUNSA|nr:hypothetical protein DUNSADRAFT_38 [Dunaliella salina]|eukprot:KAF5843916.1 hypothetical protein DUNSADRAFT_38 [Dunaliella salina]